MSMEYSAPAFVPYRSPFSPSYAAVILSDAPIAYWRLGEPSGNPQDSIGTNHVTSVGGTPVYGVAGAIQGDANTAVSFDGATEYFSVPDVAALSIAATGLLSIEFWVKHPAVGGASVIGKNAVGNYEWAVELDGSDPPFVHTNVYTAGGGDIAGHFSSDRITAYNVWQHVVVTLNEAGDLIETYLNGVASGSSATAWAAATTPGTAALTIAQRGDSVGFYPGSIDEVAIYDKVLAGARVLAHYNAGIGA